MLETAGSSGKTLRAGFIRAASDPVYINDDISQIKVSAIYIKHSTIKCLISEHVTVSLGN